MDNNTFPPLEPMTVHDQEERLAAAYQLAMKRRRRKTIVAAGLAGLVVVGAISLASTGGGSKTQLRVASAASSPQALASPSTTAADQVATSTTVAVPPPTTVAPVAATTTTRPRSTTTVGTSTTARAATVSGRVIGPDGRPVAGAYVIGTEDMAVARTNASGDYQMPCKAEPLVASPWILPIAAPGSTGGVVTGVGTTQYVPVPSTPGPGYVFSGGASSIAAASRVTCNGQPVNFTLPAGGNVNIFFVDATGAPVPSDMSGPPVDNLYLPGLGGQAALETAPLSASGEQTLTQLGAGTLRIDGVTSTWNCSGPGVTPDPDVAGATVNVIAGQTVNVTCHS